MTLFEHAHFEVVSSRFVQRQAHDVGHAGFDVLVGTIGRAVAGAYRDVQHVDFGGNGGRPLVAAAGSVVGDAVVSAATAVLVATIARTVALRANSPA